MRHLVRICWIPWACTCSLTVLLSFLFAHLAFGVALQDQLEEAEGSQLTASEPADAARAGNQPDAADGENAADVPQEPVKFGLAILRLKGNLPEHTSQSGLFGDLELTLSKLADRLARAEKDKKVSAVLLRIRNPSVGRGKISEVRGAIKRLQKAGKPVYAQLEMALASDYLIASACDQILMPETGALVIPGIRAEVTFFKRMLDKLDIEADMLQIGDYKGAAEPMTRDSMSEPFRRQYESVIDDFYRQMTSTIAEDRKLDPQRVRELLDKGLFTAKAALEAGLIDAMTYDDQWFDTLAENETEEIELTLMEDFGKKSADTDFSGMLGLVKLMEAFTTGGSNRGSSRRKKIAIVYAEGGIMTGKSHITTLGGRVLGSDTIVDALRDADENEKVAAIVLRVNSPGGSALASDLIWREIQRIEKPVMASMGDVAASGGYYISMGCDRIIAEPGTITGSIGVVAGKLAIGKMLDRVGVTREVISRGKNSGILSSTEPFSDTERTAWTEFMTDIYEQFTNKAAEGRKMELAKLLEVAGGRIWTGSQALKEGLVDQLGTLEDAISEARRAADIAIDEKVDLLILPEPKTFFEQLIEDTSVRSPLTKLFPKLGRCAGDLEVFGRALEQYPVALALPYSIEIK